VRGGRSIESQNIEMHMKYKIQKSIFFPIEMSNIYRLFRPKITFTIFNFILELY
jgi:hypothetical protein